MRQNDTVRQMVEALSNSLYAGGMVCSMTSQLYYFPETTYLNGLNETHNELVQASYHRVTAMATGNRILQGDNAPTLWNVVEYCIRDAEKKDAGVRTGLNTMVAAAPSGFKQFMNQIIEWQQYAKHTLQNAKIEYQKFKGPLSY